VGGVKLYTKLKNSTIVKQDPVGVMPSRPYQLHKDYDEKRLKKQTATRETFNFALKEIKTVRVFGSLILI